MLHSTSSNRSLTDFLIFRPKMNVTNHSRLNHISNKTSIIANNTNVIKTTTLGPKVVDTNNNVTSSFYVTHHGQFQTSQNKNSTEQAATEEYDTGLIIGLSVGLFVLLLIIVILIVCTRRKKSLKSLLGVNIPVNFKRVTAVDRAPLTTRDSDPTVIPDGALKEYHDEEIITRPLKTALQFCCRDETNPRYDRTKKQRSSIDQSGVDAEEMKSNADFEWDEFFSDEIYKKTDFSDTVTKKANAELSPGHDSGLDMNGLEYILSDNEFDFEWTSS